MTNLFQEFATQTSQEWNEQIVKDLKGKALEDILSKNYEQIPIKAFYAKEDINEQFSHEVSQILYHKSTQSKTASLEVVIDHITYTLQYEKNLEGADFEAFLDRIIDIDKFFINIDVFHNAGATAVQELAYSLAIASTYLDKLSDKGVDLERQASKISFTMAVGSNYFMEIAKLRVLPWLFQKMVSQYLGKNTPVYSTLRAKTATINKSQKDSYNNLIRTTLEAMSATIAKADEVLVLPFDEPFGVYDEFSERMATNISRILEHESKLNFVVDISSGAYFVEYLTEQLAQRAWSLFQEIEQAGGFLVYHEKGMLKEAITNVAKEKIKDFQAKKIVQIGVNKYPNSKEEIQVIPKNESFFTGKSIKTFRLEEFLEA
ncbi:MAG: methylmalonyl-CoA mutase family protein [Raineya sp.]|jgi:methylmalonyl-CoA mutase cobalamin-binding domain/chain|nr:methylmalonyl-CoA mutase family protein [Raineya sp.]